MKEIRGNLWSFHDTGNWIVIPTNGFVKKSGQNVMGRGVALQAAQRYPNLALDLGLLVKEKGNHVFSFSDYKLISFPVKTNWWEDADMFLIERSAGELQELYRYMSFAGDATQIYLPKVGAGNGKLDWEDVKPILEHYLDDNFTVVTLDEPESNRHSTERILSKEEEKNQILNQLLPRKERI